MMESILYVVGLVAGCVLAFFLGRRLSRKTQTESKTTTLMVRSIQAIAELAVLEYTTEGVTEIKEKKTSLITVRWKRGLLRYTAKLKVGYDLDRVDYSVDELARSISIVLPQPRILSCEIYNRKFYKMPLERAENVRWKFDIIDDFTSEEVLALDDEARNNALQNVNEFFVLDLLRDKTRLAFKKIFSLSYPQYSTEILLAEDGEQPHKQLSDGNPEQPPVPSGL